MRFSTRTLNGVTIVRVSGAVDGRAAGPLYDALIDCVSAGRTRLVVDLSGVHVMARAGMRGLVVAAKLVLSARGEMRLCSASRSIESFLNRVGFNHLLKCDPTLPEALARMGVGEEAAAPKSPAAPVRFMPRSHPARVSAQLGANGL